jgi:hypothetical protein
LDQRINPTGNPKQSDHDDQEWIARANANNALN